MSLSSLPWGAKAHDVAAITATIAATLSVHKLSDWLQVATLFLTIVFLVLGIIMRVMKIRDIEDED